MRLLQGSSEETFGEVRILGEGRTKSIVIDFDVFYAF